MSDLQPQSPAWQAWVAGQLAVPAGAGLPATRQAILARLEDADLAPSEQLLAAVRLGLAGQEAGGAPARAIATFAKAHREALAEAVEEFARNYWSLAPAAREAAHAELLAAAASAPLIRLRLEGLRAGLRMEAIQSADDDATATLAARVQECSVLPPTDRAVQRQELAESLLSDAGDLTALRRVLKRYPQLIRLEPNLTEKSLATPVKMKLRRLRRYDDVVPATQQSQPAWKVGGVWWAVLMLFLALLRYAGTSSGPRDSYPLPRVEERPSLPLLPHNRVPDKNKPANLPKREADEKLSELLLKLQENSEKAAQSLEKMRQTMPESGSSKKAPDK